MLKTSLLRMEADLEAAAERWDLIATRSGSATDYAERDMFVGLLERVRGAIARRYGR